MSALNDMIKRNLQLAPVNAVASGDYSPTSGLPLIKFDISSADMPTLFHQSGACSNNYIGRNLVIAQEANLGKPFCERLYCGLLNSGQDIDISVNGTGGLTIEILLKPNASTVFGAGAAAAQVRYKVSNLLLTVPSYELSGATAQSAMTSSRAFTFNSITSVFQTINSSASVIALTPGLTSVSSVFMNAINTNEIGDQRFNNARLSNMGIINEIKYSRNGMLHPNQYRLDSDVTNNNLISALNNQTMEGRAMSDSNYLQAVATQPIGSVGKCMLAYNTYESSIKNRAQTQNSGGDATGTVSGIGVLFDKYGSGENLSQTVFSVEMDNVSITGTAATTIGLYMYFLNKNTLIMSPQGLSVQK